MSEKRRGLGRGLGALIPSGATTPPKQGDRPVDVFFAEREEDDSAAAAADPSNGTASLAEAAPNGTASLAEAAPEASDAAPASDEEADAKPSPVAPAAAEHAESDGFTGNIDGDDGGLVPVPGVRFAEILVGAISPNPRQPRQAFDEEALEELAHSIREVGVLQPVVVRARREQDGEPQFELIMGERRWRAVQLAGLERIPAIVRETSDDDLLRDALLENLHRSELNALEEAAAYQQLLDDFGCTHEQLASRLGRSRPQISNTIRLLRLPPPVQRKVAAGVLSAGHARALLGLEDSDAMDRLAGRIVSEGLSVRATEEAVALTDGVDLAAAARRKPRAGGHHGELDALAARLGDLLDTRVSISLGRSKGRLSVDFASVDDLNRILEILAPQQRGVFQQV
jgi:ParB family chromosome partitioning protein